MRRYIAVIAVIAVGALALAVPTSAEQDSSGVEFWLMFNANNSTPDTLALFISGEVATSGTVSVPGAPSPTTFSVEPGVTTTVYIQNSAHVTSTGVVEQKGVRVTANAEITVYGLNQRDATTDAFLALPVDILGTDYIVLDAPNTIVHSSDAAQFGIVGTEDGTTVAIRPRDSAGVLDPAEYTITLNAGDTYQVQNTGSGTASLTGTEISASAPVAVFGGNRCTNIPGGLNVTACDHVVEQLFPESSWGTDYVTAPLATRTGGDTYRFVAGTDDTDVYLDGALLGRFDRGEYYEAVLTGSRVWSASAPILLAQYSNSSSFDGVTSDPFMMLAPPFEQFLSSYTVSTPATGISTNFVNIVARSSSVGQVTLDGSLIPAASFSAIGSSGFAAAQVPVSVGSHTFEGPEPFGVYTYGFDSYDSYGYPGGLSLAPIAADTDGDALPDQWEIEGLDFDRDGVIDVDLPAMGANPNVPDIFVEVDWMEKQGGCVWFQCWGNRSFAPMQAALDDVVAAFANAPGGPIRVHIDAGPNSVMNPVTNTNWGSRSRANRVPYSNALGSWSVDGYDWSEFDTIRNSNFERARAEVFHYVVYADRFGSEANRSSGISRGIPGANVLITDGDWPSGFTRRQERGTFMHELGHNLNLRHGGPDHTLYQWDSTYRSVMNYQYQLSGLPPGSGLDYSRGTPFNDWSQIRFDGGAVGALGDVNPDLPVSEVDSLTYDVARDRGVLGRPGDGSVAFVGPTALLRDTGLQEVLFDVSNASDVETAYTVRVTGLGDAASSTVTVAPYATGRASVPIDTTGVAPGTYPVSVELRSDIGGDGLAFLEVPVVVPDPSDPQYEQKLRDIVGALEALDESEIDAELRESVLAQVADALVPGAPVAINDSVTTPEDVAVTVDVLANDTVPAGTTLSVGSTTNGSATCDASSCTFTPDAHFHGPAAFSYTLTGDAASARGEVSVTVEPVNDAPTVVSPAAVTAQIGGPAVTVNWLTGASDLDGDALTATATVSGGGTVAVRGDTLVFTPPTSAPANLSATINYTVSDGAGGSASGSVPVTLTVPPPASSTLDVRLLVGSGRTVVASGRLTGAPRCSEPITFTVAGAAATATRPGVQRGNTCTSSQSTNGRTLLVVRDLRTGDWAATATFKSAPAYSSRLTVSMEIGGGSASDTITVRKLFGVWVLS